MNMGQGPGPRRREAAWRQNGQQQQQISWMKSNRLSSNAEDSDCLEELPVRPCTAPSVVPYRLKKALLDTTDETGGLLVLR